MVSRLGLLIWRPQGGGILLKKELEVGRGVLGRRSESSREPLRLSGVSEGSLFPLGL